MKRPVRLVSADPQDLAGLLVAAAVTIRNDRNMARVRSDRWTPSDGAYAEGRYDGALEVLRAVLHYAETDASLLVDQAARGVL